MPKNSRRRVAWSGRSLNIDGLPGVVWRSGRRSRAVEPTLGRTIRWSYSPAERIPRPKAPTCCWEPRRCSGLTEQPSISFSLVHSGSAVATRKSSSAMRIVSRQSAFYLDPACLPGIGLPCPGRPFSLRALRPCCLGSSDLRHSGRCQRDRRPRRSRELVIWPTCSCGRGCCQPGRACPGDDGCPFEKDRSCEPRRVDFDKLSGATTRRDPDQALSRLTVCFVTNGLLPVNT